MNAETDACRCQIVGWSRDPYEPHIPARAEWEQADDCPIHPLRSCADDIYPSASPNIDALLRASLIQGLLAEGVLAGDAEVASDEIIAFAKQRGADLRAKRLTSPPASTSNGERP